MGTCDRYTICSQAALPRQARAFRRPSRGWSRPSRRAPAPARRRPAARGEPRGVRPKLRVVERPEHKRTCEPGGAVGFDRQGWSSLTSLSVRLGPARLLSAVAWLRRQTHLNGAGRRTRKGSGDGAKWSSATTSRGGWHCRRAASRPRSWPTASTLEDGGGEWATEAAHGCLSAELLACDRISALAGGLRGAREGAF